MASADTGATAFELSHVQAKAHIWRTVRATERLLAGLLLIVTVPLLLLAAVVIVAISRRSPFVAHQRVGRGGRLIWVLKLRTMWKHDLGKGLTLVHRLSAVESPLITPDRKDDRVTSRFAAFCRRYSIDELPQLWQVVCGELALVGPRPLTRQELDTYYGSDAARVLSVRPGLSGLWQIRGRSRLTYAQRRRLDLFLVRKWSVLLYCKILLITLPRVLAGTDAR